MAKFDLYQEITDQVIAKIEAGTVPWRRTWSAAGMPRNLSSGKLYRGINVFLLGFRTQYADPDWLTYRQAQNLGGNVKNGEKASLVVFWKRFEKETDETGPDGKAVIESIPVLRYYRVFNIAQTEGIEYTSETEQENEFVPIEQAARIIEAMPNRPGMNLEGNMPAYHPIRDLVTLPAGGKFDDPEHYYTAAFHELTHSTGHSSRLNRKLDTDRAAFGSKDYGREELVAEMGAAFLCGACGITPATIDDSAAYLAGWLTTLRQPKNKKLLVTAAAQAQKAADYIRGIVYG